MTTGRQSRRNFLKKSSLIAAATATAPYVSWNAKAFANKEANDRPKVGCIGIGIMGTRDGCDHAQYGDVVAVCDVDLGRAEAANADPNLGKGKADVYQNYRKVLERNDIDVISISTPDHWHTKIAVEALQAGKHVFCQKPLTLTLEESQLIRKACQKYNDRVFLVGTQQRSDKDLFLRAVNMVQKGLLGEVKQVRVSLPFMEITGGPFPKTEPPKELDWDMWLGQAPKVEYIKERCHNTFRWWYEYAGGMLTDWGAHHIDIASWAIGQDEQGKGPIEIDGTDAKLPIPYKDGYPTVDDCFNSTYDYSLKCKYANGVEMIVDNRNDNGVLFDGSKGRIFVSRGRITGKPIEENWDEGKFGPDDLVRMYKGKPFEAHKTNFYRCIREGGLPVSDVYSHVVAMNTCHLCSLAARLQRVLHWDPKAEQIVGDDLAAKFFAREQRKGYEIPRV